MSRDHAVGPVLKFRDIPDCSLKDKLELLNNRILRFLFNDVNSRYDELLKKAETTSLYSGRNHKMLIVVFKSLFVSAYPKYLEKQFSLRCSKYKPSVSRPCEPSFSWFAMYRVCNETVTRSK